MVTLLTSPFPAQAQTNPTSPANRYLLIVETSRSMQRRSDGMLAAVQQLLNSGIGGQLKRGDTLGMWTYNDNLYPGRFPLQRWSPETHRAIVSLVVSFLQQQKLEKQCTFVPVLPALERLVKNSPFLTVILVSNGEQKIQGTPFDDQINTLYASWANEQQKARMPLLTILRAKAGNYSDFSVNAAPWPVEMPPLPKELLVAQTVEKKKPAPPPAKATPPVGRNIIVSGKKTPAAESNTAALVTTNAPNQIISGQLVQPVTNSPEGTLAVPSQSPPAPSPASAPETSNASPSPPSLVNQARPEKSSTLPVPESPRETPGGIGPLISNDPVVATKASDSSPAPSQNSPPSANAAAQQPLVASTPASAPSSPGQSDSNKPAGSLAIPDSARNSESETQKQSASVSGPPSVPLVAIAPKLFFDRPITLVLAVAVVAGVLVLAWIWLRRSRSARHVSLITRSLDHEKP